MLIIFIKIFIFTMITLLGLNLFDKKVESEKTKKLSLFILSILCYLFYLMTSLVLKHIFYRYNFSDYYVGYTAYQTITYYALLMILSIETSLFVSYFIYMIFKKRLVFYILTFLIICAFIYINKLVIVSKTFYRESESSAYLNIINIFTILSIVAIYFFNEIVFIGFNYKKAYCLIISIFFFIVNLMLLVDVFKVLPTNLYLNEIKNLTQNINFLSGSISNEPNKTYHIREAKFDETKIGDTLCFGKRNGDPSGSDFVDIEWIILDKDKKDKSILVLSKNGLGMIRNNALNNLLKNYKWYSGYYDGQNDMPYDIKEEELTDEFTYRNSALRYEIFRCYREFVDTNLSDEDDEKYNELKFVDNIKETYLNDTKTNERFFVLNEKEFNKYKNILGVGNFYFRPNDNYIVYHKEFMPLIYVLRDYKKISDYSYDFKIADTTLSYSNFEWDESYNFQIRDKNKNINKVYWFSERFDYGTYSNELSNDTVDIVLRPCMWIKLDE